MTLNGAVRLIIAGSNPLIKAKQIKKTIFFEKKKHFYENRIFRLLMKGNALPNAAVYSKINVDYY